MTARAARRTADARPDQPAGAPPTCRRLFSVQQAAEHACTAPKVVRRWLDAGVLPAYHLHGGVRIDEFELDTFLSSQGLKWL